MTNTMNDTRTPGEILADAVKLAEKTGHSYITVTNVCAERIIELLKEQDAVEPIPFFTETGGKIKELCCVRSL